MGRKKSHHAYVPTGKRKNLAYKSEHKPIFTGIGSTGTPENQRAFYEAKHAYYIIGTSVRIDPATNRDIELAYNYGLDIVSKFHGIIKPLIQLYSREKDKRQSNTTTTTTYYAMVGKNVIGRLVVMVQQTKFTQSIYFIYYYRGNSNAKRKEIHMENLSGSGSDASAWRMSKRIQQKIKKYKED